MLKRIFGICLLVFVAAHGPMVLRGQEPTATPSPSPTETPAPKDDKGRTSVERAFERLEWRSIGPANMGGRIADIEGVPGNPNMVYVATARRIIEDYKRRGYMETDLRTTGHNLHW